VVPAGVRVAGNRRDREKGNHSSDSKPATMGQHLSLFSSEFFRSEIRRELNRFQHRRNPVKAKISPMPG
jgi:hypothetical protein